MGSYTFKWTKPADEVYVTGTFDNWGKSAQLEKVDDSFEKTVELPETSEKIYYKYVVDNSWVIDSSAPFERDSSNNENNFLLPQDIVKAAPSAAIMSGVTPESTTAQMAGSVPLEEKKAPAATDTVAEKAEEVKKEAEKVVEEKNPELSEKVASAEESVEKAAAPKPTDNLATPDDMPRTETPLVPGNFPATPANELEKPVGINPMPAAEGGVNPIKLAPGEKVPEGLAGGSTNEHVKLDQESYEKADALPGDSAAAASSLPPVSGNMIPESSLPVAGATDAHISSAAPESTTAALAAGAPIETKTDKVPEIVKDSQEKADVAPEASAVPEEVKDKAVVEDELLKKVPEAPSTAEGTAGKGTDKAEGETTATEAAAAVGGAAVAVGGAALAAMTSVKDAVLGKATETATEAPEPVKEALPEKAKEAVDTKTAEKTREEVSPEVPSEVKESLVEAKRSPEAAANTAAVADKQAVEEELLKKVDEVPPVDPKTEPAAAAEAPKSDKKAEEPTKKAEATKAGEAVKSTPANGETPAESTAGPSKAASTTESAEASQAKKKKNRLSAMFSKVKSKMSGKH